jgi:hypothetical protein
MTAWLVGGNVALLALMLGIAIGIDDGQPFVVTLLASIVFWLGVLIGAKAY